MIWSLRTITKVLRTASTTKANDAALEVCGRDMPGGNAGLDHDQRKLGDLRQIDRRQQAGAQALLHQIERHERRHHAADDGEGRDQQRQSDHRQAGNRDGHAERDEEQRDEEIAQRRHLGGDVERIGEGRERNAGDQRAHLARQMQFFGDLADQETPGQRAEQDQLRAAGDLVEQPRQHIAAQHQSGRHQHADPTDREQDHARLQIVKARLHRQEQDREDVLQHQHAERDAPGQRVELTLLVQHLDDDDGR